MAVVAAEFDAEVFAFASACGRFLAVFVEFQRVGIGVDQRAGLRGMGGDAGHADWLPELIVKRGLAPAGGSIRAGGDNFAIRLRNTARDEHHAAIGKLREHGFIRIAELAVVWHGEIASKPGFAMIVAVDRGGSGG